MSKYISTHESLFEKVFAGLVLVILLIYTYARFFTAPYVGFYYNASTGEVMGLYAEGDQGASLLLGDKLVQVGSVTWDKYQTNLRLPLFEEAQPGQTVPIVVQRGDRRTTIHWVIPGPLLPEVVARLASYWWLSFVFWFLGTTVLLFARPRDERRRLLFAFNYLTALWLMAGTLSTWAILESAIVMRMAIWLCVPVYWRLHWVVPRPIRRLPGYVWGILYLMAIALAVGEWFQVLPPPAYFLGLLLAVVGSVLLLGIHFVTQPDQRLDLRLLVTGVGLSVLPAIVLVIAGLFNTLFLRKIAHTLFVFHC